MAHHCQKIMASGAAMADRACKPKQPPKCPNGGYKSTSTVFTPTWRGKRTPSREKAQHCPLSVTNSGRLWATRPTSNGGLSHRLLGGLPPIFPEGRHVASGKDSGQTNPIERFNNTLRHRMSRLVRKSLAFSKKLENPIGAIWYFVHHYNTTKLAF